MHKMDFFRLITVFKELNKYAMIISVDSLHIFTQMHKIHILFLIDLFFKNYEQDMD